MTDVSGAAPLKVDVTLNTAFGDIAPSMYAVDWGEAPGEVVPGRSSFQVAGGVAVAELGAITPADMRAVVQSKVNEFVHIYANAGTYEIIGWATEHARPGGMGLPRTVYATEPAVDPGSLINALVTIPGLGLETLYAQYDYDPPFDDDFPSPVPASYLVHQTAAVSYPTWGLFEWGNNVAWWTWNADWATKQPNVSGWTYTEPGSVATGSPPRPVIGDGGFPVANTTSFASGPADLAVSTIGGRLQFPALPPASAVQEVIVECDYTGTPPQPALDDGFFTQQDTPSFGGWTVVSDVGGHIVWRVTSPAALSTDAGYVWFSTGYSGGHTTSVKNVTLTRTALVTPTNTVGEVDVRLNSYVQLLTALPGSPGTVELYWTCNGRTHRGRDWRMPVFTADPTGSDTHPGFQPGVYPVTIGGREPGDMGVAFNVHVHRPRYQVITVTVKAPLGVPAPGFRDPNDLDGKDTLRSLVFE